MLFCSVGLLESVGGRTAVINHLDYACCCKISNKCLFGSFLLFLLITICAYFFVLEDSLNKDVLLLKGALCTIPVAFIAVVLFFCSVSFLLIAFEDCQSKIDYVLKKIKIPTLRGSEQDTGDMSTHLGSLVARGSLMDLISAIWYVARNSSRDDIIKDARGAIDRAKPYPFVPADGTNVEKVNVLILTNAKDGCKIHVGDLGVRRSEKYDFMDDIHRLGLNAVGIPPSYRSDAADGSPNRDVAIIDYRFGYVSYSNALLIDDVYSSALRDIVNEMRKRDVSMIFNTFVPSYRFTGVRSSDNTVVNTCCEVMNFKNPSLTKESSDVEVDARLAEISALYKKMADNGVSVAMVVNVEGSLSLKCCSYNVLKIDGFGQYLQLSIMDECFDDSECILRSMRDLNLDIIFSAGDDLSQSMPDFSNFISDLMKEFKRGSKDTSHRIDPVDVAPPPHESVGGSCLKVICTYLKNVTIKNADVISRLISG